jgi:hypothetical protein
MTPPVQRRSTIPPATWVIAGSVFMVVAFFLMIVVASRRGRMHPEFLVVATFVGAISAGFTVLVGYVYGDAKRRGMRYVMWTWLAALIPNGLGVILYFILREPMPFFCTRCGGATPAGFAFCARCGAVTAPSCRQCGKVSQEGWSHCAYCGTQL